MLRIKVLIAAIAVCLAAPATAGTISAYDTNNGASIAASLTPGNVIAADLVRGAGLQQIGGNNFRSRRWTVNGSLSNAIANNDYLEWGFTSTSDYRLWNLSLRYDRDNNGPKSIAIFASFDNGNEFNQIFADTAVSTASEIATIDLVGTITDNATFRLFGWNANSNNGRFWLRNNGVGPGNDYGIWLTAVPLPAGLPMLAGGVALLGLLRRKG